MTNLEEQLTHLNTVRLPEEAKTRMRAELIAYAELHAPRPAPISIPSPFFSAFSLRIYSGLSIALLLIVSIGGTAYAAENTLPGDILYSVKVGFTEPLQTALVPSERGKAAWNAILAERRLEEAAQLAAINKLTPSVQTELATNLTAHISATETHAAELERSGDTTGSLSVQSDLEARLTAHEQILGVIAAHYDAGTSSEEPANLETKGSLAQLIEKVKVHQKGIVSKRLALEDSIAPSRAAATVSSNSAPARAKVTTALTENSEIREPQHSPKEVLEIRSAAHIETQDAVRAREITSILGRHTALLAKFLPTASTTASTTPVASTTESVPPNDKMPQTSVEDKENIKP